MNDITGRMRRITEELREVQQQLQNALLDGPIGPETIGPEEGPVMLEEVKDFKATVDQMRHFLWFFVQAVSEDESGEKLIELLRQAAHGIKQGSALDQINSVSDYAILHYPIPPNRKPN